ncbi:hypothetical protein [Aromatoleum petrolei]|uniref:Uncharacterized protein n=1 Tax=Aromatoleum petrolei TaxID=76116 RepID=A0ABX1MQK5_9RHOO|nr:hypothetical protein [Aromatoleum petrolei]NMF90229.1 hypothetical protein [Aromatoleum petrolei]
MQLKHSAVKRGGVTSSYWYGTTQNVDGYTGPEGLRFSFTLPSKGGGDTQIQVSVGLEDLSALLKELAAKHPDFAETLAECTQVAVSALLESKKSG